MLILSLFPGFGLLDMAFEARGHCVLRSPDKIHGGDIRNWHWPPTGSVQGIIAGPPCQGFSKANMQRFDATHESVVNSREMLHITVQIIDHCQPEWALIENVPHVPDVRIDGYCVQRIAINNRECGGKQLRWRTIQFCSREGKIIRPARVKHCEQIKPKGPTATAVTTKPTSRHMTFRKQCRLQGLTQIPTLEGVTRSAKFRWIGNGVPLPMGDVLARAVEKASPRNGNDCVCGCGRVVAGVNQKCGGPSCRKRIQLDRERARPVVDVMGFVDGRKITCNSMNFE